MPTLRAPKAVFDALKPPDPRSEACLNCGTPLIGPFCSACGQRDIPPYPSVRELVIDAFWELSGWDGRFAATVRALVTSPGALTREFLEGRRARYLSPLRLYLMASLVYFVLAAAAPPPPVPAGVVDLGGGVVQISTSNAPARVSSAARTSITGPQGLAGAARDSALADVAKAPAVFRPFLRRVLLDPAGFKRGMAATMPRMLFALVPIFAAIVGLFYRKRKYPEHLYFGIHLHSFLFLALSLDVLARFTHAQGIAGVVQAATFLWILAYATLAFRRVYGGTIAGTVAKEIGIGALYLVAGFAGLMATIYWVALFQ